MTPLTCSVLVALTVSFSFASAESFDQNHMIWNKVLTENVVPKDNTTQVNYKKLLKDQTDLNTYLKSISAVSQAEYSKWNDKEKLAFLFNAYNAFTVKLILQELEKNADLKSIKKIGGLLGNPWKIKFFRFLGKESFLDEIEQDIARKNFDEPRLHFAFNCASIGCPSLQPFAFVGAKLDEQLDAATRSFLKDPSRNQLDPSKSTLSLSSILKWYNDDFENSKKMGPLRAFLIVYFPFTPEQAKMFEAGKYEIKYLPYNWNLNQVPN